MKLQSCLMIQCIVPNTISTQELLSTLEDYIKQHFLKAVVNLKSNEPYWKEPECNKIIYNLLSSQFIPVSEFIKHLHLSWHYKKFGNEDEDAVWSQLCNPEESFLIPEVRWAHIYTWEDNKEPVIN